MRLSPMPKLSRYDISLHGPYHISTWQVRQIDTVLKRRKSIRLREDPPAPARHMPPPNIIEMWRGAI